MQGRLNAQGGYDLARLQFLSRAAQAVVDIKRGLKWSFAFLYFRPDDDADSELELFKEQQANNTP